MADGFLADARGALPEYLRRNRLFDDAGLYDLTELHSDLVRHHGDYKGSMKDLHRTADELSLIMTLPTK